MVVERKEAQARQQASQRERPHWRARLFAQDGEAERIGALLAGQRESSLQSQGVRGLFRSFQTP